ncbi:MAG: hypothetical protein AABM64_09565 [Pseudomonadota bacterium]
MNPDDFIARLNAENNPDAVRKRIAAESYSARHAQIAQWWLDRRAEAATLEAATRAEAREEENLSISRAALRISDRANKIAVSAIILSVVTAIVVAIIQFIPAR